MSNAIYSNAAMVTAFLATIVKITEGCRELIAKEISRALSEVFVSLFAAAVALALLFLALIPQLLALSPQVQEFILGAILLVIGMRWLRKSIFTYIDNFPTPQSRAAPPAPTPGSRADTTDRDFGFDWLSFVSAFRIGFTNALQLLFILTALALAGDALNATCTGALLAAALVIATGFLLRSLPIGACANRLQFSVGALLSAFGTFWTAEGLGLEWPRPSLTILVLAITFWATGWAAIVRGSCCDQKYATIIPFKNPIP